MNGDGDGDVDVDAGATEPAAISLSGGLTWQ